MNWNLKLLIQSGLCLAAVASVVAAALPVARHMAGVVVLEGSVATPVPSKGDIEVVDLTPILELAPFGRPNSPASQPASTSTQLPDLILRGILASVTSASRAFLDVDGIAGMYRRDDAVGETLILTDIAEDHVTLSDGSRTVTLWFDGEEKPEETSQTSGVAAGPSLHERLQDRLVVAARYEKPGLPETTSEYIDYWRKRIQKNPQAVLDEIGLKPTEQGYVIADRHDAGVRLAGLQSGDLVRSVNGQQVGDPDKDRQSYDRIAAAGHARIEVERGDRILTFSFPLR